MIFPKYMRFFKSSVAAIVLALLFSTTAYAAEFIAPPDLDDAAVTVPAGESHKNLYTAGATVVISSDVTGDLYAAGGTVTIEGRVEQDLSVAGGNIVINGPVGGDLRVGGGSVVINSQVAGDVLIGGGSVRLTNKASVGGDLVVGGGKIELEAPVAGSARIGGGTVTINSKISGSLWARINDKLIFYKNAEVTSGSYASPQSATVTDGAKVSSLQFNKWEGRHQGRNGFGKLLTLAFLIQLIGWSLLGLLLIKFNKFRTQAWVASTLAHPWENIVIGLIGAIVIPVVFGILLITIVGYYIAFLMLALYVVMLMLSGIIGALAIGSWLLMKLTKKPELQLDWQAVLIGVIIVIVLRLIPIVGWIAACLIMLAAFGTLLREAKNTATTK